MSLKLKLTTCYICNVLDLILTLFWVNTAGLSAEGNPIGRLMLQTPSVAVAVKVFGVGAALMFLYFARKRKVALWGTNIVFFAYLALTGYHAALLAAFISVNI